MFVLKPLTRNDAVAIGSAADRCGLVPTEAVHSDKERSGAETGKPSWPRNSAGEREIIFVCRRGSLGFLARLHTHATSSIGPKKSTQSPKISQAGPERLAKDG